MRLLLSSLPTGQTYMMQLRAETASAVSEWSTVFSLTTSADTSYPQTPTGLAVAINGTSFIATWNQTLLSSDGTPAVDLRVYRIKIASPGSVLFVTRDIPTLSYSLSFDENIAIFGGTPQGTVNVSVAAVDSMGNTSPYSSVVSATNPAPAPPTAFVATSQQDNIALSWTASSTQTSLGDDFKEYRVYSGSTALLAAPGSGALVWRGNSTSINVTSIAYGVDTYYTVTTYDIFNTASTSATSLAMRPTSPFVADTTAPAVPTGLAGTLTNSTSGLTASIALSWSAVADPANDLASYIIGYKPSSAGDWQYVTVDYTLTSTIIDRLTPYVNYDFRIRSSDWAANLSSWSGTLTKTATANTAPAASTGVTMVAGKDNLTISWTENTELDVVNGAGVYEVQIATNIGFSTGLLTYRTGANSIAINGLATATTYYTRVRAVDSLGLAGAYSTIQNIITGTFPGAALSDGNPPASSPTPVVSSGIGFLFISWTPISNADPVIYELHISTTTGFTAGAGTKVAELAGSTIVLERDVVNAPLAYGTTYYVKTIAKDRDGAAASSAQGSGTPVKATSGDITTIGANQITTGTVSANTITIGIGGIIQTNTGGVSITDSGIIIPAGMLDANIIKANTSFVTTINVGSGGVVQSTGYTVGGTSGFRLSTAGLDVKGTGNTIAVESISAGTITAKTINIGATGVLNVDSTGSIKSNNWSSLSTGYELSNAGLEINDGSVDAKALRAGSAVIGNLVIGRTSDALGDITSFGYSAGTAGFRLHKTGLEINSGSISAAALKIQVGQNLMPVQYADFEFNGSYYASAYSSSMLVAIGIIAPKYGTQCINTVWGTSSSNPAFYFGSSLTDYNVNVEASTNYIVSVWTRTTGSVSTVVRLNVTYDNATTVLVGTVTPSVSSATWVRVSGVITVPAGVSKMVVYTDSTTWTASAGFDIDGVQVEKQTGALTTPSAWTPPSATSIDGGYIRTGEIRSNTTVMVNAVAQPAWSINLAGNAQFGSALVRGTLIVGASGDPDVAQSYIASGNFISGADGTGWKIDSSGYAEFNSGMFRGTLGSGTVTSDAMSSEIIIGGSYKTSDPSLGLQRVELDSDGLRLIASDNSAIVNLSATTGARFSGDFTASSLSVNDNLSISGQGNNIGSASRLTVSASISSSVSSPVISLDWPSMSTASWPDGDSYRYGWSYYSGNFYTMQADYGSYCLIQRYSSTTGARDIGFSIPTYEFLAAYGGVTILGGVAWVLGQGESGSWAIRSYNLTTGAQISYFGISFLAGMKTPAIGNNGTNLLVAFCNPTAGSQYPNIRIYNTSGVQVGYTIIANVATNRPVVGALYGTFDYGAARTILVFGAFGTSPSFVDTYTIAGAAATSTASNDAWQLPTGAVIGGLDWNGTNFVMHSPSAKKMYTMSTTKWLSSASSTWYASTTWNDDDATGGTHATPQGPRTKFTMIKRSRLNVTLPAAYPPRPAPTTTDDALTAKLYLGLGVSDPGRANMELNGTINAPTPVFQLDTGVNCHVGTAASAPSATNTFVAQQPGIIASNNGTSWSLSGDGAVVMPIPVFTSATLSGAWVDYGSPFATAGYTIDPAGWVTLRGLVKSGAPGTIFTLPAGYRPLATLIFDGHANTGIARIDVSAAGLVSLNNYTSGGTNAFVSLSSVRFATQV